MKYRLTASAVLATLLLALMPVIASAQILNTGITVPVTTTLSEGGGAGPSGTFTIQRFANQGGQLVAIGTLVLQTAEGLRATAVAIPAAVAVPQQAPPGACDILNLVLGPLNLNLLGLVVDLEQVVLDIFAVPGPGNLLGNLLCAITGLLDGAGTLNQLVLLLNRLLTVLG